MKKIRTNKEQKMLESVNNTVNTTNEKENTMTNEEMMKMITELSAKVEGLSKPRKSRRTVKDDTKYRISGRIKLADVDSIKINEKGKGLPPQAKHSLRSIIKLRDEKISSGEASGTITFTRPEWAKATEQEVDDWDSAYVQTGDRINMWYHHQNHTFVFQDMKIGDEKIFI